MTSLISISIRVESTRQPSTSARSGNILRRPHAVGKNNDTLYLFPKPHIESLTIYIIMSLQTNRRRSLRSAVNNHQTTTPPPRQTHLIPLNRVIKRTNSKSSSSGSASSGWQDTTLTQSGYVVPQDLDQTDIRYDDKPSRSMGKKAPRKSLHTQTLTQAGFVSYQSPVFEDMVYDEEPAAAHKSTPQRNKRRRIEKEEPIVSRTRSVRKRTACSLVKSEDDGDWKNGEEFNKAPAVRRDLSKALMPPPKTPQSARWREVPSSQSPVDTPLSIQSRRSKDLLRSPLKAKSVNARRTIGSPGKAGGWARTLQVADSMENDDEDESPTLNYSTISVIPIGFEPSTITRPLIANCRSKVEVGFNSRHDEPAQALKLSSPRRKARSIRSEISDSDDENIDTEDDDSVYEPGSQIDSTESSQKASRFIHRANPTSHSSNSENEETPKQVARPSELVNIKQTTKQLEQQFRTPQPAHSVPTKIASQTGLTLTFDPQSASQYDPHHSSPKSSSTPHVLSISSPAEIPPPQINQPSSPHSSPRALPETESQFQNAWRDFSPPPLVDETLTPDLPIPPPSLPMYPPHIQQQQQQQLTQSILLPPIPPSQATTVDITQQQSSPRPLLLSSSSPSHLLLHAPNQTESQDTLARDIGGWEAVRLTDSQLVLDSLIDDAALGFEPLGLLLSSSQGSYDEGG